MSNHCQAGILWKTLAAVVHGYEPWTIHQNKSPLQRGDKVVIQALDEEFVLSFIKVRSAFSQDWTGFPGIGSRTGLLRHWIKEKLTDTGFILWLFTGLDKKVTDENGSFWYWIGLMNDQSTSDTNIHCK
jgi:hypothetical protein